MAFRFVVGGTSSCAELAPWNALLERKPRRKKRFVLVVELIIHLVFINSLKIIYKYDMIIQGVH